MKYIRNYFKYTVRILTALIVLSLGVSCGNPLLDIIKSDIMEFKHPSPEAPTASLKGSSAIVGHESVVIEFSDSMDTKDVEANIKGDMASSIGTFTWSKTTDTDDTLTIKPSAVWPTGLDKSLIINGKSTGGTAMAELSESFNISARIHVSTTGTDGPEFGTASAPCLTIQYAIDRIAELYETGEVRIAKGTYAVTGIVANLKKGVSLYGGYSDNDWVNQDRTGKEVILQDNSTAGGASNSPSSAVYCDSTITDSTVIDGITVIMGTGNNYTAGIFCEGSPVIQYVTVHGRASGDGATYKYGILVQGASASPLIQYCDIDPGECVSISYAVYTITNAKPEIRNNTLYGGIGGSGKETYALYFYGTGTGSPYPIVDGNDLYSGYGTGVNSHIALDSGSVVEITNNDFHKHSSLPPPLPHYGIIEIDITSDPSKLNNNIFDCDYGYLYLDEAATAVAYDAGNSTPITTLEGNKILIDSDWGNTVSY
ncbi:MAG: hypothetical protein GXP33_00705 [Spirochaetes bacterium]|nr:hypothetical protein [Spirochaetota bacterium]